jgi:hypothetical protein
MSEICDYLLDFDIRVVDPTYKIKIFSNDMLIRQLGAYHIIDNDLLRSYLLAMKLAGQDPSLGKVIITSRDSKTYIELLWDKKEKLVII